jgi:hypothetical protein
MSISLAFRWSLPYNPSFNLPGFSRKEARMSTAQRFLGYLAFLWLPLWFAPWLVAESCQAEPQKKSDADRIAGVWLASDGAFNGKKPPADFFACVRITFTKDGKVVMTLGDDIKEGKYVFPAAVQIDLTLEIGLQPSPGIYKSAL